MIQVIKRCAAWKRFLPLILAFQFAAGPIVFVSRGFDLPRLSNHASAMRENSQEQSPIYSAFLAHHKRASNRVSAHKRFASFNRIAAQFLNPKAFPVLERRLLLPAIHLAKWLRPPAGVLA